MRIVRLIFIFVAFLSIGLFSFQSSYAVCDATDMGDAGSFLKGCWANTIGIPPDMAGDGVTSIKEIVINFAEKTIAFGALFAIGAIVFSGIQYTISYGDDEKVKKAKSTGIYAIIWLVILLTAFSLVDIVVNFIYYLGS